MLVWGMEVWLVQGMWVGTCGADIVSSAADMLEMIRVHGMRSWCSV